MLASALVWQQVTDSNNLADYLQAILTVFTHVTK